MSIVISTLRREVVSLFLRAVLIRICTLKPLSHSAVLVGRMRAIEALKLKQVGNLLFVNWVPKSSHNFVILSVG